MKLFSRSLTDTDCLKRLYIPERVLAYLPHFHGGYAVELLVSFEARQWSIVCTIRKKGRYKKPVLSRGWRKFVVGNSLSVGDELTLHKEEDETGSLHYRVEVKRATCGPSEARRRNKGGKKKREQVVNCTHQTSDHQFGFSVDGIASATDETKNRLPKHVDGIEEPEKKLKLFGTIILPGAVVVGASETVDHTAYHNSFEQFGLTVGGAELVNGNVDQASLKSDQCGVKEETAATLEHFGLGVTADGVFLHFSHDQVNGKSYQTNEERLGSELEEILGQSLRGCEPVNLDLTLAPPHCFMGE